MLRTMVILGTVLAAGCSGYRGPLISPQGGAAMIEAGTAMQQPPSYRAAPAPATQTCRVVPMGYYRQVQCW